MQLWPYQLARHHMSECCVKFSRIYEQKEYSYTYGELNIEDLWAIVKHTLDEVQKEALKQAVI